MIAHHLRSIVVPHADPGRARADGDVRQKDVAAVGAKITMTGNNARLIRVQRIRHDIPRYLHDRTTDGNEGTLHDEHAGDNETYVTSTILIDASFNLIVLESSMMRPFFRVPQRGPEADEGSTFRRCISPFASVGRYNRSYVLVKSRGVE
jgi:hypothetical protein